MFAWENAQKAGVVEIEGQSLQSQLRRGWYLGSQAFREQLLSRGVEELSDAEASRGNGYTGAEMKAHEERKGERMLGGGLELLELPRGTLPALAKNDWIKVLLAELIRSETTLSLPWISQRLSTGTAGYTCQLIGSWRRSLGSHPERRKLREEIVRNARSKS